MCQSLLARLASLMLQLDLRGLQLLHCLGAAMLMLQLDPSVLQLLCCQRVVIVGTCIEFALGWASNHLDRGLRRRWCVRCGCSG